MKRYILAITGASGAPLGLRVLQELSKTSEVHVLISNYAFYNLKAECGLDWNGGTRTEIESKIRSHCGSGNIFYWPEDDMTAPVASGSFQTDGMFVVPCSMKTLAGIRAGYANNLIERTADVTIKEGRRLILAPREMPLSAIHLENMLSLARMGVHIAPPVMAFYHGPKTIDDMIGFCAGKILDLAGVEHKLFARWGAGRPE